MCKGSPDFVEGLQCRIPSAGVCATAPRCSIADLQRLLHHTSRKYTSQSGNILLRFSPTSGYTRGAKQTPLRILGLVCWSREQMKGWDIETGVREYTSRQYDATRELPRSWVP